MPPAKRRTIPHLLSACVLGGLLCALALWLSGSFERRTGVSPPTSGLSTETSRQSPPQPNKLPARGELEARLSRTLGEGNASAVAAVVHEWLAMIEPSTPDKYLAWTNSMGITPTDTPELLARRWEYSTGMLRGAQFAWSAADAAVVNDRGQQRPAPWAVGATQVNTVASHRAPAQGAPDEGSSVTVDVYLPGKLRSADGTAEFDGHAVLSLRQRTTDGRWIPVRVQVRGWPVGIRVLPPPI